MSSEMLAVDSTAQAPTVTSLAAESGARAGPTMAALRHDSATTDFTVTCGAAEWRLHAAVLATKSPFFRAAVLGDSRERLEGRVAIKGIDAETMEQVVNFMYGLPIAETPVHLLVEAAETLQMADLKEEVARAACKAITMENAVYLGQLAETYHAEELLAGVAAFLADSGLLLSEAEVVASPRLAWHALRARRQDGAGCGNCGDPAQYWTVEGHLCGACAGAPSIACVCNNPLPDPDMLVCGHCGLAQHGACFRVTAATGPPPLCCLACSALAEGRACTDTKMVKLAEKNPLGLEAPCLYRRVLVAIARVEQLTEAWLIRRFGLEREKAEHLVAKLVVDAIILPEEGGRFKVCSGEAMEAAHRKYLERGDTEEAQPERSRFAGFCSVM